MSVAPRFALIALLCAVAVPATGCGGGAKTTTTTVAAPTTAPAPSAPSTVATPAPAPASAPAGGDDRDTPITVKGRRGDALTLLGQYLTSPSGAPEERVKVKVRLDRVRGPFEGFDVAAGHKLVGLDLHVTNLGTKRLDDALPGGILTLVGGETGKQTGLISAGGSSPCVDPSLKLRQGESKDVCIAFDVPQDAELQAFQYAVDSGYGDAALWKLR